MYAISDALIQTVNDPGQPILDYGNDWITPWIGPIPRSPDDYRGHLQNPPQHGKSFNVLSCDVHVESVKILYYGDLTKSAVHWNNDHEPHPEDW
jgi:hypothetical protein